MSVSFSQESRSFLEKCPANLRKRILKKIKFYSSAPDPLEFAEHLTQDEDAPYRYRVGDWRVKFSIKDNAINIKRIGHRSEIYKI